MNVNFSESYQKRERERESAYGDLLLIGLFIKNFFFAPSSCKLKSTFLFFKEK